MRFGAPVNADAADIDGWIAALKKRGYRAAFAPVEDTEDEALIAEVAAAAERADIVIAEVGAWSNPLSPDEGEAKAALEACRKRLWVADRMGARCCVNIAGSRGAQWDGPHPENLSEDTFDRIVETVRAVIDAVNPTRTFYTLEPMPWIFPDSPDNYLRLVQAVDRKRFGVHLDPVNMINSPERFFNNAEFIRECFAKLGRYIKSCHVKDIALSGTLTVHLDEVRAGLGGLDHRTYLEELRQLDPDAPLLLEHLETQGEFDLAAAHIRAVAEEAGIAL